MFRPPNSASARQVLIKLRYKVLGIWESWTDSPCDEFALPLQVDILRAKDAIGRYRSREREHQVGA